jgi:hypothetical protein
MHGHGKEALKLFEQMCAEGVKPDDITFVCLLSACSHALVDEGRHCYASMVTDYMISAKLEHYTYLYGRPSWPCWPSTGGREYGHGSAL